MKKINYEKVVIAKNATTTPHSATAEKAGIL